jgi:hypothetical protein
MLGVRALHRALIERQLLASRRRMSVEKVLEHLVGMQAQVPDSPYLGIWSRLAEFRPDDLSKLIERRSAVRLALMRSTIHLVTARDCLALRPVLQEVQSRSLYVGSPWGQNIEGMDVDALVAQGRALLEERPRTIGQLGKALGERWPDRDATSLGYAVRNLVPMVQVPPRGLWGANGVTACTTAEAWLGLPLDTHRDASKMIKRYLAAFGPASVRDVQAWSGLRGLQETVQALDFRTFRDPKGETLYDLPRGPRPDPDTAVPPRFLSDYDNALLAHADRTRIFDIEGRRSPPIGKPIFFVDGFVQGRWRIDRQKAGATLKLTPFARSRKHDVAALTAEGSLLLAFVEPDAGRRDLRVAAGSR